jgi:hypothetical protein
VQKVSVAIISISSAGREVASYIWPDLHPSALNNNTAEGRCP